MKKTHLKDNDSDPALEWMHILTLLVLRRGFVHQLFRLVAPRNSADLWSDRPSSDTENTVTADGDFFTHEQVSQPLIVVLSINGLIYLWFIMV